MSADRRLAMQAEAEALFHRTGITFADYGEGGDLDRLIPFDVAPRVFTGAEWARLVYQNAVYEKSASGFVPPKRVYSHIVGGRCGANRPDGFTCQKTTAERFPGSEICWKAVRC